MVDEKKDAGDSDSKKDSKKKEKQRKKENKQKSGKSKINSGTLKLVSERDIAMDFATKVYKEFDKIVKSVVLFGSSAKRTATDDSDIDIIIIIDDAAIKWDPELITWYREELGKLIQKNPYKKSLHINTVKLSTWWQDLLRGDPIVINILRYGEPMIDFGGFFTPLQVLLKEGKINSTPESIYTLLQRAPIHLARAYSSMLAVVDGLYWSMVDSAHAVVIAANIMPPSPEHIALILKQNFVDNKLLDEEFVDDYRDLHFLTKEIVHGKKKDISGEELDKWFDKTEKFVQEMTKLVDKLVEKK